MSRTLRVLMAAGFAAVTACSPQAGPATAVDAPAAAQERAAPEFATSELTAGLGLPFSESVRVGDLLLLSGMIGMRPGALELVPGGMEAEARQTLANIDAVLRAAGASRTDVLKCTVMLDDMSQWPRFNQIYAEFFGSHRPVRSAFGADGLALGATVEVECIATAPAR